MSAGQDPALFWALTPLEIDNIMAGCADRARLEHQGRAWLAWHAAALPRMPKLPDIGRFMNATGGRGGGVQPGRRQSMPEMIAALKAHTSLMEGMRNRVSGHRKS